MESLTVDHRVNNANNLLQYQIMFSGYLKSMAVGSMMTEYVVIALPILDEIVFFAYLMWEILWCYQSSRQHPGEIMLLIQIIKIQYTISVLSFDLELLYTIVACNSHNRFLFFWMIFVYLGIEIECCQDLCVVLLYVIL